MVAPLATPTAPSPWTPRASRTARWRASSTRTPAARLLEDGARRLRARLTEQGVPTAAVAEYLSVLGEPEALEAALAWYRAAGALTAVEVGPVTVPTLYVWGDADATVGPAAAFVTDQDLEAVTRGLLSHLAGHR